MIEEQHTCPNPEESEKGYQQIKQVFNRFGRFKEQAKQQYKKAWEKRFIKKNCSVCLKLFNELYTPNQQKETEPFK